MKFCSGSKSESAVWSPERYAESDPSALEKALLQQPPRPQVLEIHPTSLCQLSCEYCHSLGTDSKPALRRNAQRLSLSDYGSVIEQFTNQGGRHLVLSGGGEPLLADCFTDLAEVAAARGLRVHVYTNGLHPVALGESSLRSWLPHVSSIRFSIHRATLPRKLHDVLRNAAQVMEIRNELGLGTEIHAGLLVDSYSREERAYLLSLIADVGFDYLELKCLLQPTYEARQDSAIDDAIRVLEMHESVHPPFRISARRPLAEKDRTPTKCCVLYRSIVLDSSGGYRLCCMRAHLGTDDFSSLGFARETTLAEALLVGQARMQLAGRGVCEVCSPRDALFAKSIATETMRIEAKRSGKETGKCAL